ncbi:MAG: 4-hydroxythreonine-4-phosphate dehydrogenase PdxA [Leptolyngbyaceae cyanobacterium]
MPTQPLRGMSSQTPPKIAVTLGDPAGIGPEVVAKALAGPDLRRAANITVIGDSVLFNQTRESVLESTAQPDLALQPVAIPGYRTVCPGKPTPETGHASFMWLQRAIAGAVAGEYDAIVTAPIAKAVWHQAGHDYPGQTEVLAEGAGVSDFAMAFAARSPHTNWPLRTLLATTHIPLRSVPEQLSPALMSQKLDILVAGLAQEFGVAQPRIAVAGLNPHSGEAGKLGREEQDWLIPWLEQQRSRYTNITLDGPVPPDTLWVGAGQAWYRDPQASPYDAYLALYHDQGLIPVKLMAFDRAVNFTLGLPFVRTSPDHGTAFDIAGKGIAQADSMVAAIQLAIELVHHRHKHRHG